VVNLDFEVPLGRFVCLSGVSGSGKSTLLDNVVYQGLLAHKGRASEDPAVLASVAGSDLVSDAVLVDQGPVSRTPRSNPALYV
jgi:excinuclease ABC subunit A